MSCPGYLIKLINTTKKTEISNTIWLTKELVNLLMPVRSIPVRFRLRSLWGSEGTERIASKLCQALKHFTEVVQNVISGTG